MTVSVETAYSIAIANSVTVLNVGTYALSRNGLS